jgi:hypothetical protein
MFKWKSYSVEQRLGSCTQATTARSTTTLVSNALTEKALGIWKLLEWAALGNYHKLATPRKLMP